MKTQNPQKQKERIALFDIDGTLADFDGALKTDMKLLAAPDEISYFEEQKDEPAYITRRRRLIKGQPGWWANLPKFQLGWDVLEQTQALGFSTMILSKGPRKKEDETEQMSLIKSAAWAEKVQWIDKHLPDVGITLGTDKGLVYGSVLVDDWIDYVKRWLTWRPRGLVIMPAHNYNEGFKHPNVVRYDGTNLAEVVERLKIQCATEDE